MNSITTEQIFLVAVIGLAGVGVVLFAVLHILAANRAQAYLRAEYPALNLKIPWLRGTGFPYRIAIVLDLVGVIRQPLEEQDQAYHRLAAKGRVWAVLWLSSLLVLLIAVGVLFQP